MKTNTKIILGVIGALVIGLLVYGFSAQLKPGRYDELAQCLADKGAVFYGAFWCPHCQNQKKMFGTSADKLPYVECSTPDGKSQLPACNEKQITGYPTWIFADGERREGEVSLRDLAEKTGCTLP